MLKRVLAVILVVLMAATVLSACGGASTKSAKEEITVNVGGEPLTIDPSTNSSTDGGTYIMHAFEGLTKIDKNGKTVAGVAKNWDVSSDGTKYTFHLRDDAKWSDGQPVKAQDFEYSWKRALDPATASEYAYQLWYLKNGQAASEGSKKVDEVGVKATDDKTLEVTLEYPTTYFLDLVHFPTYMPLRKDIIDKYKDQWIQKPETYIGNGAYKMTAWNHKDSIVFEKNDQYYDKDSIKLKKITWKLMEDDTAALSSYEAGEVDVINGLIPQAETKNLIDAKKAKVYPMVGTYYVYFNIAKKPLDDARVRKALALAIDRKYIVENVTMAGQKPAVAPVPYQVPGAEAGKDFRSEGEALIQETANVTEAQKLLADAGYPGGKGFPEIEIYYNTQSGHKAIMEAIQQQWKTNLGITVKNPVMEWKVLQDKVNNKDFTMARMGWIGDYNDPMTFLDMWTSTSSQNNTNFANKDFDNYILEAKKSNDQKVRMEAMHKAEKIFMDEMPAMPIYYYVSVVLHGDNIKNMNVDMLGFTYLHYAYFTE